MCKIPNLNLSHLGIYQKVYISFIGKVTVSLGPSLALQTLFQSII
jgi:hypothetical protein